MKILCAPESYHFEEVVNGNLGVVLYGHTHRHELGSVGATVRRTIHQCGLQPAIHAWDLLSIALSVIAADTCVKRHNSPDGWTRRLNLEIAVCDPDFWNSQTDLLVRQLNFLTTDIWNVKFLDGGIQPIPPKRVVKPNHECVVLLSGGLDSFIGAIDLVYAYGKSPYAVSQVSQGDKSKQKLFAAKIGGGLPHLQLNHNTHFFGENERSQRSRSFIFLSYGVLAATALARYHNGKDVTLYVCENGFISINPPLTDARLGSLSTRTTHPTFIDLFQHLIDASGLRVKLVNPYQFRTKGEMLKGCADHSLLHRYAHISTSCGRYARYGYKHCGRCLPCLIRRAAFQAGGIRDATEYIYANLSRNDEDHSRYDDVRSAAMAVAIANDVGITNWAGPALSTASLNDITEYRAVVYRGLDELQTFLGKVGVR